MRRLISGLAVAAVALAVAAPAARADATPEYFAMPAGIKAGEGLDAAPDGTVYFGTADGSQRPPLARLDPALAVPEHRERDHAVGGHAAERDLLLRRRSARSRSPPPSMQLWWTRSDGVVGRTDFDGR